MYATACVCKPIHPPVLADHYQKKRLSDKYQFEKPNDPRALDLMNAAAVEVVRELQDLIIAYGVSDEFR